MVQHVAPLPPTAALDKESNTQRAYRELRQRILRGEMPPGAQYLEQQLAEILHMSRTPVREALIRLADERLVEVRPRHGVRILPLSVEEFRDIHEMWAELESLAVRRLATRGATNSQLAALEAGLQQMVAAVGSGNRSDWYASKRAFHDVIQSACGNARLAQTIQGLIDQSACARQQALDHFVIGERINLDHAAIIDAVRRRDADQAASIVRRHRIESGAAMADLLSATHGSAAPLSNT